MSHSRISFTLRKEKENYLGVFRNQNDILSNLSSIWTKKGKKKKTVNLSCVFCDMQMTTRVDGRFVNIFNGCYGKDLTQLYSMLETFTIQVYNTSDFNKTDMKMTKGLDSYQNKSQNLTISMRYWITSSVQKQWWMLVTV